MPSKPQSKRQEQPAKRLLLISGIAILLWSGLEDNDARLVTLLGALLAAALCPMIINTRWLPLRRPSQSSPKAAAMLGALIGLLTSITTPMLMLFKDLRHAHAFPDYPAGMMLATLERMPHWTLAGGLAGIGIGILLKLGRGWRQDRNSVFG